MRVRISLGIPILTALVATAPAVRADGDPNRGRDFFQQNCALCHLSGIGANPATGGQGPSLIGVMGRRAGSRPDFGYTPALSQSGTTWTPTTLDRFLSGPTAMVPGTAMAVVVARPEDRANLIAFLGTLHAVAGTESAGPRARPAANQGDWQNDSPGTAHRVRLDDLPVPYATKSAGNSPHVVKRPANANLAIPPGFKIKLFTSEVSRPRLLRVAPNGDIFIAETSRDRIRVLRAPDGADVAQTNQIFAEKLNGVFGMAFYPNGADPHWLYVALLNSVVRFPYHKGDLQPSGPAQVVVPELARTTGGHTTRDLIFSADGKTLFISVGSASNVAEDIEQKTPLEVKRWEANNAHGSAWGYEEHRANILTTDPEGKTPLKVFATGIRNPVGLALHPESAELWTSTNERDGLGDDLVPDYVTRVQEGGFYGWPWYYLGYHEEPRHRDERPDLQRGPILLPDVLIQSHSAALQLAFYPLAHSGSSAFPVEYRGDLFVALHGSWNRTGRTGSKIIRVRMHDGTPTGAYEDFVTGFVIDDQTVWGRPVGVAVAHDGALLFSDDANDTIWRVSLADR